MSEFLPKEVRDGLEKARKSALKASTRLRIHVDQEIYPVLRVWDGGFALDADAAPQLRGLVDLYDGTRHLSQCLIVASSEENGEIHCEYKRMTEATGEQPLDFYRAPDAPVALLPNF